MHIGFILSEYSHEKIATPCAGIGTSSKNIVEGLLNKNHKVSVFIYGQECNATISEGSLTIHKIKKNEFKYFGFYRYRKKINTYVNKIVFEKGIDILEAPDWTGITAFMKFAVPHVLRLHGSDTFFCHIEKRVQKKKNYFFEKLAFKNSNAVIGVSEYVLNISKRLFKSQKKATVIPNGLVLNENLFDESSLVEKDSILCFGSVIRKKGVLELAEIFNKVILKNPQVTLSFLGRDVIDYQTGKSTLELFKELLSIEAKENFKYLGVLPYSDLNKIVLKSSICVLPSLAESFGMVTIEAMYLKKTVVSTNYPWAKEIITNAEVGCMEDPKNHEAFASKILSLLKNDAEREIMGQKAHEHVVGNYAMKSLTDKNIQFYKKVLSHEI